MKQLHVACNLATGEVICTARACALRRRIAHNEAWDKAHGYYMGSRWIFAHGEHAFKNLRAKVMNKGVRI